MSKLVCGVGINDCEYPVSREIIVDGKRKLLWICPFYLKWKSMITRCYSKSEQKSKPSYSGCLVIDPWHRFTVFKAWMETQDWEGKSLDKDLLFPGNKVYSPETCIFIDAKVNTFLTESNASRGEWPIGVSFNKAKRKFESYGYDSEALKRKYLGCFSSAEEAHKVWLEHKLSQAYLLASKQSDKRVALALIDRYENYNPN